MTQELTLSIYESVAQITQQMLAAARSEDWEKLAELEMHCAAYASQLAAHEATERKEPLTGQALSRKVASIRQIMADDRELRFLVSPWLARMSSLMDGKPERPAQRTLQ